MHNIKIIQQNTFMSSKDVNVVSEKLEKKVNAWIKENNIKVISATTTTTDANTKDMVMVCTIVYEDGVTEVET